MRWPIGTGGEIVLDNDETGAQTEAHQKTMMQEIAKLVGTNPRAPAGWTRRPTTGLSGP